MSLLKMKASVVIKLMRNYKYYFNEYNSIEFEEKMEKVILFI